MFSLNVCALRIAGHEGRGWKRARLFRGEARQRGQIQAWWETSTSKHDSKRLVHLNRRTLYLPRVQRNESRLSTCGWNAQTISANVKKYWKFDDISLAQEKNRMMILNQWMKKNTQTHAHAQLHSTVSAAQWKSTMSLPFERLDFVWEDYGHDLDQEVCAAKEDSKELEKKETSRVPRATQWSLKNVPILSCSRRKESNNDSETT